MAQKIGGFREFIIALLIIVFVATIGWLGYDVLFQGESPTLDYNILSINNVGKGEAAQTVMQVRVNATNPSLDNLRKAALEIYTKRDDPSRQLTIEFYIPGMNTAQSGYAIAKFNELGLTDISLVQK